MADAKPLQTQSQAFTAYAHLRGLVVEDNRTEYSHRIELLRALRMGILARQDAIKSAINEDFGGRPDQETVLADIIPTIGTIDYTIKHLSKWMQPQKHRVALHFLPAKNRIEFHPKGLVLIISPWNYPILLSLLPLATALGAGNRVIVKPSECTPKTSEVTAQLVRDYLPSDRVQVLTGGAEVAIELCNQDFDHILFTGSTRIGRAVMKSAAEHLTPVTLELGGKSPCVIHPDYDVDNAAMRIARGKLLNAGQTCVAPDFVMVQRGKEAAFVEAYRKAVNQLYPDFGNNPDYASIVNQQQFERLQGLLEQAKQKGAKISVVGNSDGQSTRKRTMLPHIVEQVHDDMDIMREEIFGPILPVVPFDTFEVVSDYLNQRPRPLALYYFDHHRGRVAEFLGRTISGSAAVNDTLLQFAQDDLPFGGVGNSGMGVCHGFEGFKQLSHAQSVLYQAKINPVAFLDPPYGKLFNWVTKFLTR